MNIDRLSARHINPPAARTAIEQVEAQLGMRLPDAYRELLACANGIRFDNGLVVYPLDDVIERNQILELFANVAGLALAGTLPAESSVQRLLSYGRILRTRLDNPAPGAGVLLPVPAHTWLPGCRDAGKRESGLLIAPVVLE